MTQDSTRLPSTYSDSGPDMDLRELLRALLSGWRWILGTTFATVLAVAAVTRMLDPTFESSVLMRMKAPSSSRSLLGQLGPLAQFGGLGGIGTDEIDTQVGVLESRRIAENVVESLGLRVRLVHARTPRDSVLRVISAGREEQGARYLLRRTGAGAYRVVAISGESDEVAPPPDGTLRVGVPVRLAGVDFVLLPQDGPEAEKLTIEVQPFSDAVDALRRKLDVKRQRGGSRLVEITYPTPDRLLAAAVPNAIASDFAAYEDFTSSSETSSKVRILREQAAAYGTQLHAAEEELRRFQETSQTLDPKVQTSEAIQRLSRLQAERDAWMVERDAISRLLTQVQHPGPSADGHASYRKLAAFPAFVSNQGIQDVLQSLITLGDKRAELLVLKTPQNNDVRGIDARIEDLEDQLMQFGTAYLSSLGNQIDAANGILGQSRADLATVPARAVEFARRTRDVELLNQVYAALETQLKTAEIENAVELGTVRVVDSARVPRHPVSPRPLLNLALALVLGSFLGVAVALARRLGDPRIRAVSEAEAASGIPVLEVVPLRASGGDLAGDAYQSLWLSLYAGAPDGGPSMLVVSSTTANDGKSATAAGLAFTLERHGLRTLLVDADLRKGTLHERFGVPASPGLLQVLRGEASLEDVTRTVRGPGDQPIHFLASGGAAAHPADLLGSAAMRDLLARARNHFEVVILDTPPVNQVRDGVVLRAAADGMILVAQMGATSKEELGLAANRMRQLNLPVQGMVLHDPRVGRRRARAIRLYPRAASRAGAAGESGDWS